MSDRIDRRTVPDAMFETRAAAENQPTEIVGYAAVFDEWTTLLRGIDPKTRRPVEIREIIRPGAFAAAIAEAQDVRALVDHNSTLMLGRTRAGTLSLAEDARGLRATIRPSDTHAAHDVMANIRAGNISQMSFAFTPRPGGSTTTTRQEGDVTIKEIEVTSANLFDVSVVTYPAYKSTSVSVRCMDIERSWIDFRRERIARLEAASAAARK